MVDGTDGQWIDVSNAKDLERAVNAVKAVVPSGGTSLLNLATAAAAMSPPPDNIYLVTDGLPTLGKNSGARHDYHRQAARRPVPRRIQALSGESADQRDHVPARGRSDRVRGVLGPRAIDDRRLSRAVEGLAMKPRRPVEEMSMSFLDVICCGFGAVILLLMTTKFIPPTVLETIVDAPRWHRCRAAAKRCSRFAAKPKS